MRNIRIVIFLAIFLSGALPRFVYSDCISDELKKILKIYPNDSSVELELGAGRNAIQLLTTVNGKISGLLRDQEPPDWLIAWAKEQKIPVEEIPNQKWDSLSYEDKIRLIAYSSRNISFWSNRSIPGLATRDFVMLEFDKETELLGKKYPPGKHKVDISNALTNKVEYLVPNDVGHFKQGLELHFRISGTAGSASRDAWTLLNGFKIKLPGQHVHIVDKLPLADLKAQPELTSARLGMFHVFNNYLAEMRTIVENGRGIKDNIKDGLPFFASLTSDAARGVTRYFYDVAHGENRALGVRYKLGWVGMRGSDYYDGAELWGTEYRAIGKTDDPVRNEQVLNAIQYQMKSKKFAADQDKMKKWLGDNPKQSVGDQVSDSWYNRPLNQAYSKAPRSVQKLFSGLRFLNRMKFAKAVSKNTSVKMLLHDWSKLPLYFDQPEKTALFEKEQVQAVNEILSGKNTVTTVKNFLLKTGIYNDVLNAYELKPYASDATPKN